MIDRKIIQFTTVNATINSDIKEVTEIRRIASNITNLSINNTEANHLKLNRLNELKKQMKVINRKTYESISSNNTSINSMYNNTDNTNKTSKNAKLEYVKLLKNKQTSTVTKYKLPITKSFLLKDYNMNKLVRLNKLKNSQNNLSNLNNSNSNFNQTELNITQSPILTTTTSKNSNKQAKLALKPKVKNTIKSNNIDNNNNSEDDKVQIESLVTISNNLNKDSNIVITDLEKKKHSAIRPTPKSYKEKIPKEVNISDYIVRVGMNFILVSLFILIFFGIIIIKYIKELN